MVTPFRGVTEHDNPTNPKELVVQPPVVSQFAVPSSKVLLLTLPELLRDSVMELGQTSTLLVLPPAQVVLEFSVTENELGTTSPGLMVVLMVAAGFPLPLCQSD